MRRIEGRVRGKVRRLAARETVFCATSIVQGSLRGGYAVTVHYPLGYTAQKTVSLAASRRTLPRTRPSIRRMRRGGHVCRPRRWVRTALKTARGARCPEASCAPFPRILLDRFAAYGGGLGSVAACNVSLHCVARRNETRRGAASSRSCKASSRNAAKRASSASVNSSG